MVKCESIVWLSLLLGISMALLTPSKKNIWSDSWPSSVGRGCVHSETEGDGNKSTLPAEAPVKEDGYVKMTF